MALNIKGIIDSVANYSDSMMKAKLSPVETRLTTVESGLSSVEDEISRIPTGGSGASDSYSTSEVAIGYWIDGSTVYKRTISFDVAANATETIVLKTLIPNIKAGWIECAMAKRQDQQNGLFNLPMYRVDQNNAKLISIFMGDAINLNNATIADQKLIVASTWGQAITVYATIRYLKNT